MAERKKGERKKLVVIKKRPADPRTSASLEQKPHKTLSPRVPGTISRSGHLPMPNLAYQDPVFMESLAARPLRVMAEYIDPLNSLRRANVADTIVIFGSARIQPRDRAEAELKRVLARAGGRRSHEWRTKITAARSILNMSKYYEEARELAHRITTWALGLGRHPKRFVICSGGGPGIMEAANRGALEAGGSSIGLSIQLPHEQQPNPYISADLNFCFHYFFMRKLWFAQMAKALIVFPGGFGTMDELWEMLTLLQTNKLSSHHLILIYGREYWDKVLNWREMVNSGTISEADYNLLQFADSVDEAFERVRADMELHHLSLEADWDRNIAKS